MPTGLPDRCVPDCIREFTLAARERFVDGVSLARTGRRTAAIYLWGYVGEMVLKAAYFRVVGFSPRQQITIADLRGAKASAPVLGLQWNGNLHHLESWGWLLVLTRSRLGSVYTDPHFHNEVISTVRRLHRFWTEILRYHKNVAYVYEVDRVRTSAEWLLLNAPRL